MAAVDLENPAVKFGPGRWTLIRQTLSWAGNFIAGYRVYVKAYSEPAQGKYFTSPADADSGLQWLVERGYLKPVRFAIQPERRLAVGTLGYSSSHLKSLSAAPVPGHFVDWDYEVLKMDYTTLNSSTTQERERTLTPMARPSSSSSSTPARRPTASLRPEDMVSGGLPDDIDAIVTKARLVPWNYDGKRDEYSLALRLDLTPDPDTSDLEPFSQYYSAGDLAQFVPTMDGVKPAGTDIDGYLQLASGEGSIENDPIEEYEGVEAMPIGKRDALNNNTNLAYMVAAALGAGFPPDSLSNDVRCFEGMYAHWNRLQMKERKIQDDGGQQGQRKGDGRLLVPTEVKPAPKGMKKAAGAGTGATSKAAAKPAPASKTAGRKPATTDLDELEETDAGEADTGNGDTDPFSARVADAIAEVITAIGEDGTVTRGKMIPAVMKKFSGAEKAKAMKVAQDEEFLAGQDERWIYDEEEKTLTLIEE